jgi:N-carbamoyl-L-amino-acid hydrolase
VIASVDLRNPDDALMRKSEADLIAFYEQVGRDEKVSVKWRQTARTESVAFASKVQERVAGAAAERGLSHEAIVSGAGHDAQEMARLCPAGMVFVPGEYDGISHNPREYSTAAQCGNGIDVLLDVLLSFAEEGGAP